MASHGACLSAIVVAGGRSSRLGGEPKALLRPPQAGAPELVRGTVEALLELGLPAQRVAVVGPPGLPLPPDVLRTREDPPFSGPASALAAGAAALGLARETDEASWTLTLACDMPRAADAARALIAAVDDGAGDGPAPAGSGPGPVQGIVLSDREILQPLAAAYRSAALGARLAGQPVIDRSVRRVLGPLWDRRLPVRGLTDDVDTWDDVSRFGLVPAQD